jgi:hypothetical protein
MTADARATEDHVVWAPVSLTATHCLPAVTYRLHHRSTFVCGQQLITVSGYSNRLSYYVTGYYI